MFFVASMFVLKDQNYSLDHMAEVEDLDFDPFVLKVCFYLVSNICMRYGF